MSALYIEAKKEPRQGKRKDRNCKTIQIINYRQHPEKTVAFSSGSKKLKRVGGRQIDKRREFHKRGTTREKALSNLRGWRHT